VDKIYRKFIAIWVYLIATNYINDSIDVAGRCHNSID
jgi:hypothetical protein